MSERVNKAQCYEQNQWRSYQAGTLSESERRAMEEHLLTCEACLENYLSIVEYDLEQDASMLGKDFTDRLFEVIGQETNWRKSSAQVIKVSNKKEKEVRNNKVNLLISYCAAASIAMFFWVGGYFDGLSGSLSKGLVSMQPTKGIEKNYEPQKGFIQTGWTQRVIDEERPSFIENLKLKKE